VSKHTDLMNANIAELIMGLDDVTAGFSAEFNEMRTKTGMESFIGIFSSAKAESMRQERMRAATIDDKLQDLISKSDVIVKLLQGQLDLLNTQKTRVEGNLASTLTEREETVAALEAVRAEVAALDPRLIELENKIAVETDAAARTKLETELATLNAQHNALVQDEQVKLETDTKQRVVLYDALTSSLKTAQQQDVAHRINEIGVKTDQEAQTAMAAIGAATNDKMADMLEAHEGHMVFARAILEQKAKADERFARRFAAIVEKHDKNAYGE
jgi:chromosome segregation ATPase